MDDVALIEVLRDAAEALSLATIRATSDTAVRILADLARECMDAATELAHRHLDPEGEVAPMDGTWGSLGMANHGPDHRCRTPTGLTTLGRARRGLSPRVTPS